MSDQSWRARQRDWEANPGDQLALQRALSGRRRAGQPLPGRMLAARIHPARGFNSVLNLVVFAELPGGEVVEVGRTPGSRPLEVPAHLKWWVQPQPSLPLGMTGVQELATLPRELSRARVPGLVAKRSRVTDPMFVELMQSTQLRHLELGVASRLTEGALKHTRALPELFEFALYDCGAVADPGLAALGRHPRLSRLTLTGAQRLTDAGFAYLSEQTCLTHLHVASCDVTDEGLAQLSRCEELQELRLENCGQLGGENLSILAELPELRTLNLSWCKRINDGALEELSKLVRLEELVLQACQRINDQGLAALASLRRLRVLNVGPSLRISAEGLTALRDLPALRQLSLGYCAKIDDQALAELSSHNLEVLNLAGCKRISSAGFEGLLAFPGLKGLSLEGCERLDPQGLASVVQLKALERLDLSWCSLLDDAALGPLSTLGALKQINLSWCGGLGAKALEPFLALPSLERLRVEGCEGVPVSACEAFRRERPDVRLVTSYPNA